MAKGDSRDSWSPRISCSLATEFSLVRENVLLQNNKLTNLYVIQAETNPFLWFGVLFVDHGPYMGAVLRFNMYIDDTYPDCSCPKIVFYPIPSHPLVNPITGELDTKNAFPNWDSNSKKLYELLLFVKRVIRQADEYIIQIRDLMFEKSSISRHRRDEEGSQIPEKEGTDSETASNNLPRSHNSITVKEGSSQDEADGGVLGNCVLNQPVEVFDSSFREIFSWFHHTLDFIRVYVDDPSEFQRRIDDFKEKCNEQLLDRPVLCGDDMNAIVFTPWNPEVHESIRSCVLAGRFTPSSLFASYHKETDSVSFVPGHGPGLD